MSVTPFPYSFNTAPHGESGGTFLSLFFPYRYHGRVMEKVIVLFSPKSFHTTIMVGSW